MALEAVRYLYTSSTVCKSVSAVIDAALGLALGTAARAGGGGIG